MPLAAIVLESGTDGIVQAFAQIGGKPLGSRLVASEAGDSGGHGRIFGSLVKPLAMAM